ncbi:MAG: AsmA family protein [Candidatus Lindowbacteria bacterium]|nr:AsmA family protein [Candidatus Lindowbacteria bacterium]
MIGINPNSYKPEIKQLAEKQGISVDISGDLDWQFLPNLAIQVGETHVTGITQSIPDTRFKSASLSLSWKALLKRQIAVQSIQIDGADIHLENQQQAVAATAAPIAGAAGQTEPEPEAAGFSLSIDRIEISNSRITFPGKTGSCGGSLQNFALTITGLNLTGKAFALETSFDYRDPSLPDALEISFQSKVSVNPANEQVAVSEAMLKLSSPNRPPVKVSFDLDLDGKTGSLKVPALLISSDKLSAKIKLDINNLRSDIQGLAQIDIPIMNLREVLADWSIDTSSLPSSALQEFGLYASVKGSSKAVVVEDLSLTLDGFSAKGSAYLNFTAPKNLNLKLAGTKLDISRYINTQVSSTTEVNGDTPAMPVGSVFAPLLAPVAWLEGGNGLIDIKLEELTLNTPDIKDLTLKNLVFQSRIRGSVFDLTTLSADTFGGSLLTTGEINLRSNQAKVIFTQKIKGISIEQAAKAFGGEDDSSDPSVITGILNFDAQGTSKGLNAEQLHANLAGKGQLQIKQPTVTSFNIERAFCDIAALVGKTEPAQSGTNQQWPVGSQLTDLEASFKLKGHKILLDPYTTGLGNLSLRGKGKIDAQTMTFNILAVTRLNGDRTSENGCVVNNQRIRDKDIPIRCKDSFANAGAKSCGPDGDIVKQLLQDAVFDKISEKIKLDKEGTEAIEGLLKGLFGR